jgi:peptidoglycan/xylan/chitin deacetylase (PgdA/CDA1 family)
MSLTRRAFLAAAAAALGACGLNRHRRASSRSTTPATPTTATSTGSSATGAVRSPSATGSASAAPGGPADLIVSGPRDRAAVALTFHGSGELRLTNALLAEARRLDVPITVFAVGSWLDANPSIARQLVSSGHEVANHTYTHPGLGSLGRSAVFEEISRCRDVIIRQLGSNGRWFRPSGIDRATPLMLEQAGLAGYREVVGFDVDPHDYQDPGAAAIVSRVAAGVQPGSIVSLHLGHSGTVQALDGLVGAIRARGLEPVVLGDLLGGAGR